MSRAFLCVPCAPLRLCGSSIVMINKLVIFGVGLIGGSLALALREAGAVKEIVGLGRSRENLEAARTLGIIDRIETDLASAVKDADVVLLAVPVAAMQPTMAQLAPYLCAAHHRHRCRQHQARRGRATPDSICRTIWLASFPAHPIAGAEKSGATAAIADLFQGRNVVVTPLPENDRASRVHALPTCGRPAAPSSTPCRRSKHDEIFAAVSHLPHLLSFALVEDIAFRANASELFSYAAGGFRDFTRIAGSSPGNVARHLPGQPRCADSGTRHLPVPARPPARHAGTERRQMRWKKCSAMPAPPAPNGCASKQDSQSGISPWNFSIFPPLPASAAPLSLPGSKSISNRTLLLAALAEGVTEVKALLASDDTGHMLEALTQTRRQMGTARRQPRLPRGRRGRRISGQAGATCSWVMRAPPSAP